jgi:hypothetical protein
MICDRNRRVQEHKVMHKVMKRVLQAIVPAVLVGSVPSAASAVDPFRYISPRPGARLVNPQTTIILRPETRPSGAVDSPSITVRGSASGPHAGDWIAAEGGGTLIFRPRTFFAPGETVSVIVRSEDGGDFSFDFAVSPKTSEPERSLVERRDAERTNPAARVPTAVPARPPATRGSLVPPVDLPPFTVTVSNNPTPGYVFVGPRLPSASFANYAIMFDNSGSPAFFREVTGVADDFKKHPHAGLYSHLLGGASGEFHVFDDSFELLDSFHEENGYTILDGHDFQILPNGNFLIAVQDWQQIDMSKIVPGGNPNAWVVGFVMQEQDPSHNVVFEWRSWDHFEITDAVGIDFTGPWIDYVHFNAFEYDTDGNIMFSCREMCEITKIDRQTGNILWRFGGTNNEFTLVGDTQWFERQHSVRRTPTGTVTIFDNGALDAPWESRAVEYDLDEVNKIATLVWQYRHDPPRYAGWGSNMQRLPNSNTMIGWAPLGIITEVRSDGTKAFEAEFADHWSYRAFRFEWDGVAARPELWHEVSSTEAILRFAKFGDPDVALFHIYAGTLPDPTTRIASTPDDFFVIDLQALVQYVRVTAEDSMGNESPYSNQRLLPPIPVGAPLWTSSASQIELFQNRPNPFGLRTTVSFALTERGPAELSIYDVSGRLVRTLARGVMAGGPNDVVWDGTDASGRRLGSGVYFYRLVTAGREMTRRMALLR